MKITVFTSNQPRHINLINLISEIADETYAVIESNTLLPGIVKDFYNNSPTMKDYMVRVRAAEADLFGTSKLISRKSNTLVMKSGDLNNLTPDHLKEVLQSDVYVVFGSSFIQGWLVDFLIEKSALNIHMGLSPHYRGSSCNFWAMFDSLPNYVGATIHVLTKGLDSGPIVFHSVPEFNYEDPFKFSMKAVKKAQEDLVYFIKNARSLDLNPVEQDIGLQIRYTRNSDFTDEVALEYLERNLTGLDLGKLIINSVKPNLKSLNLDDSSSKDSSNV
jgi:folate-dependent phosphoribosylglycinamide formyltransferase PurN